MCGRFVLTATPEELAALFGYLDGEPFPPRYNIAPTQPIAIVRMMAGTRRFHLVRWGLIPWWVEDAKSFRLLINLRAEGILDKPSSRDAMRYRRCLVPASGFYEWRRMPGSNSGKTRQPFWLKPRDGKPIAFAGLWETWHERASGGEIDSGAIVTTDANAVVAPIHDRMPVVIRPEDFDQWLNGDPAEAAALLRPAPDDVLEAIQISNRVNSVANDDPTLLEPAAPTLF
jgi:putative SOS response-associated peptidase YedK